MNNNIESPLFSVLIANFNNGHYIKEAIESVINQSYKNWEIVVVDDASTDNSKKILKEYNHTKNIRIFHNDVNKGCGYTKNKCVNYAKGEISGFLDPDDKIAENAVYQMVNSHKKNIKASLIYSTFYFLDDNLKNYEVSNFPYQIPGNSSYLKEKSGRISHFATFKTILYNKTSGINPKFIRAVDQDLYYKLEEVGDLIFINEPLYYYRIHEDGISNFNNRKKAVSWSIIARIDACNRRNISIEEIIPNILEDEENIKQLFLKSIEFRIGEIILRPIRFVKSKLGFYK